MHLTHDKLESFIQGAVSIEKGDTYIKPWRLPHDRISFFADDKLIIRSQFAAGVRLFFQTDGVRIRLDVAPNETERIF